MRIEFLQAVIFIIGSSIGSFIGATVWRLRSKDLAYQNSKNSEYKKIGFLSKSNLKNDRSRCLECQHKLAWYDLIPVLSWLMLNGKCRYCHKPIGRFEIIIELITAVFFLLSYLYWPYDLSSNIEIIRFVFWLVLGSCLLIIAGYDSKWSEIPALLMYVVIGLSAIWSAYILSENNFSFGSTFSLIGAIIILSGFYLFIYVVSKGKWIGFGDVQLGLALALLLTDWKLAFLNLFIANFIGTVIVLPGLLSKKIRRTQEIPFGPMYIAGFFIVYLWGDSILNFFSLS